MSPLVEKGGGVHFSTCWREISGDRVALFIPQIKLCDNDLFWICENKIDNSQICIMNNILSFLSINPVIF